MLRVNEVNRGRGHREAVPQARSLRREAGQAVKKVEQSETSREHGAKRQRSGEAYTPPKVRA